MAWFNEALTLIESTPWKGMLTVAGSASTIVIITFGAAGWWYKSTIKQMRRKLADQKELLDITKTNARLFQRDAELRGEEARKAVVNAGALSSKLTESKVRDVQLVNAGRAIQAERNRLRVRVAEQETTVAKLLGDVATGDTRLATAMDELERRRKLLERGERRIKKAIGLDGFLWMAKSLRRIPRFLSIQDRRQAIVSVLNLKGGVGKTTVTAQLGAAFARRGYRVLFIDLDLQGSLTDTLLPLDRMVALGNRKRFAQDFFTAASLSSKTKLQDYIEPVAEFPASGGTIHLLGASDTLGYTELTLTLRWLVNASKRDSRFLLRRALHTAGMAKAYDVVLIDCPPIINMSCINAVAASDYVLVPSTLERRAVERVPVLLSKVLRNEKFLKFVHHGLKLLGLVANRTRQRELTTGERDAWGRAADYAKDAIGHDVRRFPTTIPGLNEFRDFEGLLDPAAGDSRAATIFRDLSLEIEQEWPDECRRTTKTLP